MAGGGVGTGMSGVIDAFSGFFSAFNFILRNRMGWLFLVPALLWMLLSLTLYVLLSGPVEEFTQWLLERTDMNEEAMDEGFWKSVLSILGGAREVILAIVLKLMIAYLLFTLNKYLVLVLLSPLLAYASERAEEILTGRSFPGGIPRMLKDALRGSFIAMRNGFIELLLSVVVWVFTFILPIIAPLSVLALFMISAYFYGFSMFDYILERRRMRMGESVAAINARVHMVLVNGALFSLLMKIPLVGMTFAPVMAAVGAVQAMARDPLFQGSTSRQV